jgi:hypothetical protein
MYKRSLENEYYESLEEILTLPENFKKLINPTNDAGLEKISELLDAKRGYDESNIKGRLVNRNYMTKLRHAFITGKKWVGIAAVNITNLSLRQKSKVYLDPSKLSLLPKNERKFMRDISIVLPHNTLNDNGQTYVSLSATKTADGTQFISDRLSGYATAFVDIANKPFITKIVKSDVVVSTFMFLESIGAGNTGIYFLNQPIIEQYLEYLDSINSKSVTSVQNLKYIRNLFPTTDKAMEDASISVEQLLDNIEEYYKEGKFDKVKNAEQQLILSEFIKYKILADQLFSYTQATNYDTTKFGSSDSLLKKEWGTFNASNFNLISNVKDVLDKTFIGKQADFLSKAFDSFGAIMKTELPEIKAYTLSTLKKYATRKYMSMDDYEKIANLIKNSFLDYVIQNNTTMENMIKPLLVDAETSIVGQLEQAKQKYPSMQILQDLTPVLSSREGGANSIKLKVNTKDAYSENLYVGMMREMRDIPELNDLYNSIVNVAILQGTTQSAISIRNIIPVEDYAAKIAPFIQQLRPSLALEAFANGVFERNNFKNEDLFKEFIPNAYTPQPLESTGEYHPASVKLNPNTGEEELIYSFFAFKEMRGVTKTSRRLLTLNDVYNSFQLDYDFIKIPKVVTNKDGVKINIATGLEITKKDYAIMKEKGSQDLYNNYYYKKVYTNQVDIFNNPIPLRTYNQKIDGYEYYYKLINVYGDGNRATEINTDFTPSVINNGSVTIKEELNDIDIVNQFASQIQQEFLPLPLETTGMSNLQSGKEEFDKLPSKSSIPTMTYAGIGSRETPQEVLKQMTEVAKYLDGIGYTLQTGFTFKNKETGLDEEGADKAFSDGSQNKVLFGPSSIRNTVKGVASLESYDGNVTNISNEIVKEIHPAPDRLKPGAVKLMARNTNQIFGKNLDSTVDFVLFYAKETDNPLRPKGGTGQAVEMARRKGIPTINLANSNWKQELDKVLSTPTQPSSSVKADIKRGSIILFQLEEYQVERVTDKGYDVRSLRTGDDDFITKEQYDDDLQQPTETVPERVTINLQPDNREMIANGQKTTTIRTQKEFEYIGLPVGATARTTINGLEFNVTNRGLLSIDEVGKDAILKSEGLASSEDFKFPTSKKWFDGQGKLYVYDFTKANVTIDEQLTDGITYETVARYTDADVKANPDKIYIFGDNTKRTGTGGQAQIRNNPNAMGIATKLEPSNEPSAFMSDDQFEENKQIIDSDIAKIIFKAQSTGKTLVFPADGFGTGLAQLSTKAPKTYDYLRRALNNNFGFWNGEEQPPSLYLPKEKGPKVDIFELRQNIIDYTSGQVTALEDIANIIDRGGDGHYLLAGYAGTGKTTIAENIAKYAKEAGKSVLVIAPTNKAAKVLNDKLKSTGVGSVASTIHKTIYGEPNEFGEWEKSSDIKNSVVIIDESSMIEKSLMEDLLSSTKNKNNVLIFMGDSYQLQPVGEDSGLFQGKVQEVKNNQTELTEVKRQSLDSNILKVATIIRNDKKSYIPTESTEDFIITKSKNQFVENFKQAIKNNEDVAMIVATNNERILMNKVARNAKFEQDAQEILNPNETIISIANSTEYSNSEIFNVKDLRGTPQKFDITFTDNFGKSSKYDIYLSFVTNNDNREVPMLFFPNVDKPSIYHAQILKSARETSPDLYDALEGWIMNTKKGPKLSPAITIGTYGYSITAHKSQGSQWDKVFVNQNYVADSWDAARWFYTAITRAAKEVEVFPTPSNIQISNAEINSKLNNIVQENVITENFDTIKEFTSERKKEILTNFADKHKLSLEQAKEHINKAIAENREEVINKLKDCY